MTGDDRYGDDAGSEERAAEGDDADRADELDGAGDGDAHGVHATAADTRLTDLLRGHTSAAHAALGELRARHRPAVLGYARLCTADEPSARQLTAQAFELAAHETVRGLDPKSPWRHHLLLLTGRVATSWATDERADRLDRSLLAHLRGTEPAAEPRLLAAFQSLPTRVRGLVWYGVVEEEPDDRTAVFLGCTREDVTYGSEPAFQALRHAVLTALLARSANPRCQDFRRLIEEAAHPESPRHSADLQDHMAHCGHCAGAYQELAALRDTPRTALAEGLLAWAGTAYVMGGATGTRRAGGTSGTASDGTRAPAWPPSRRVALVSAALGAVAALLLLYLLPSDGSDQESTAAVRPPTRPPAVTAAATATPAPTSSPRTKSPTPTRSSSPSKSPIPTPTPTRTTAKPKPTRTKEEPHPPNGAYAQVVNASSGLCLDIRGGVLAKGTDVVTARCSSSRTQYWRYDADRGVLQSYADPGYCLDSRGSPYRGVGIWECVSVDGPNGRNLRFTVDADGAIVPAIAPGHAVTPYGPDMLFLLPDQGRADQRWRAGARPA